LSPFNRFRFGAVLTAFFASLGASLRSRAALQLEILALRHQLGVLQRSVKRPRLSPADRFLWAWLSSVWNGWESRVFIVKAATVIGWHRKGFGLFWSWKIHHGKRGRPAVPKEVRQLIRMLSCENPLWGVPHIHGELLKLGINIGETSVSKYIVRHRKPPSQGWRTFLDNHLKTMVSVDFFVVPTIRFQILYVFLVLAQERRRILHFAVAAHPTAEWTAQQVREAFPWDVVPRYLLRDRDSDLRAGVRDASEDDGHPAGAVSAAFPVAACLGRAGHRHDSIIRSLPRGRYAKAITKMTMTCLARRQLAR